MRFFWFHTSPSSTAVTPSALFSVAAHAVCLAGAVYGSGPRPDTVEEEKTNRIFYLPPPDRIPGREAAAERVQFIEVGAGVPLTGAKSATGQVAGKPAPDARRGAPDTGAETISAVAEAAVTSADSVYSILNVEQTAVRVDGSAAPIYPPELIAAGVEGIVNTRFIVDTTGLADTTTLQVLASSHPAFTQSVRTALGGMRFTAANVDGRRVRQLVEQAFEFRITPMSVGTLPDHTRTKPVP